VGAVLAPGSLLLPEQAHEGFAHECGWLQGVVRPLGPQVTGGQTAEFRVQYSSQMVQRLPVPIRPLPQESRYLVAFGHCRYLPAEHLQFRKRISLDEYKWVANPASPENFINSIDSSLARLLERE